MNRLSSEFFHQDVLEVAPQLLGKVLVRTLPQGILRVKITEVEIYRGEEDTACHASKGRTKRTETLYQSGGCFYVYLCYGVHWLMNIVTGEEGHPQAALLRGGQLLSFTPAFTKEQRENSFQENPTPESSSSFLTSTSAMQLPWQRPMDGPGKLTRAMNIHGSFNGLSTVGQSQLYLEDGDPLPFSATPRIGIGYATQEDQQKLWRFLAK